MHPVFPALDDPARLWLDGDCERGRADRIDVLSAAPHESAVDSVVASRCFLLQFSYSGMGRRKRECRFYDPATLAQLQVIFEHVRQAMVDGKAPIFFS